MTLGLFELHSGGITYMLHGSLVRSAGDRVHRHVRMMAAATNGATKQKGKCWLVGCGPGPTEYLTLKAVEVIKSAEVLLYDDLGAQDALKFASEHAEKIYVGKRGGKESSSQVDIDRLLVDKCDQGLKVARLKGGCPSVFSRVGSEMAALSRAGIEYELVPGMSSALSAPLFAGFPLTDTSLGNSFAVLTGHDLDSISWPSLQGLSTLVFLMAARNLPSIAEQLQGTGWAANTPVAVVKSAGLPDMAVHHTNLAEVGDLARAESLSPCVVIVGQVAGMPSAMQQLNHSANLE